MVASHWQSSSWGEEVVDCGDFFLQLDNKVEQGQVPGRSSPSLPVGLAGRA